MNKPWILVSSKPPRINMSVDPNTFQFRTLLFAGEIQSFAGKKWNEIPDEAKSNNGSIVLRESVKQKDITWEKCEMSDPPASNVLTSSMMQSRYINSSSISQYINSSSLSP